MDNILKMGKAAYEQYSDNQSKNDNHSNSNNNNSHGSNSNSNPYNSPNDLNLTGGAHLNRPAGGQWIDTDGDGIPDFQQAAHHATENSGASGDASLFNNALSFLKSHSNKDDDDDDDIDEERVTKAHDRAYNQGQGGSMDAKSMGMAAALQAFKQYSSGGISGGGQSKLIGMAMAQAAKLFDKSGGASNGQKQDAVNSAGKMVMKLLMKEKMGKFTGGGNSGGLSGLASLASKLNKVLI
ncbi:hypothetical protein BY996DRAFT_6430684 [Phakopsora pachyrhizi]|nr:hypothetical protein BY996DRAFT_6430684 [Phakopsora pachyrhizi]